MILKLDLKQNIQLALSDSIHKTILVCSHERSGTHFLMNSIAKNSNYSVEPYLNYDSKPFGGIINFFDRTEVKSNLMKLISFSINNKKYNLASIIKSHHPPHHFEELFGNEQLIFLYIYRSPLDTLVSFWKFIERWDHHEGPKGLSCLDFINAKPEGQMMRYQYKTYDTIFDRWANHVLAWYKISLIYKNVIIINYDDLINSYEKIITDLLKNIGIPVKFVYPPDRDKYFKGANIKISNQEISKINEYIIKNLFRYPELLKIYPKFSIAL